MARWQPLHRSHPYSVVLTASQGAKYFGPDKPAAYLGHEKDHQTDSWHFNPRNKMVRAIARLTQKASLPQLNASLAALAIRHTVTDTFLRNLHFTLVAQPLSDVHFNSAYDHDGIRKANRPVRTTVQRDRHA